MVDKSKSEESQEKAKGKPISLHPLAFEEALADALKVKPETKAQVGRKKNKKSSPKTKVNEGENGS